MTQREQLMRIFRYELTPKRAGRLTLPAATVEADGKTYRSQELVLRVKAPEEQDLVKMTITAEPKAVYPMHSVRNRSHRGGEGVTHTGRGPTAGSCRSKWATYAFDPVGDQQSVQFGRTPSRGNQSGGGLAKLAWSTAKQTE